MTKTVTAAEAKAHLSALVSEVAYGDNNIIIERRGKPLAALVSISDLERLQDTEPAGREPRGALALLGAWADLIPDEEIDRMVADIYAARERETGRPVELEP